MENFQHIVSIDDNQRKIIIYRLYDDGTKHFYTETNLPKSKEKLDDFCNELGFSILVDSPLARSILNL